VLGQFHNNQEGPVAEPDIEVGPGALHRDLVAGEFEPWFQPRSR
jgi:hypothetical protein